MRRGYRRRLSRRSTHRNGHGHLLYGLRMPLRMALFGGREAPVRFAETIERAMTAKLRADTAYSGFMCKNPLHKHWTVLQSDHLFTLPELHGWLGDLRPYRRKPSGPRTGIGRNIETFDAVRAWAYRAIREYWELPGGSLESFVGACIGAAERYTAEHHDNHEDGANRGPLQCSECRWIGRSIGRWTWRHFTPAEFSRVQSERGKGGKAKRAEREERNQRIRELAALGFTQTQIGAAVGVHRNTVGNVMAECTKAVSG